MDGIDASLTTFYAEHVLAKLLYSLNHLPVQFSRRVSQDMMHPSRSDNGKTFSVGNVVVSRQCMLHGMHWPSARTVAKTIDTIAAKCRGIEYLCTCIIVLWIHKHLLDIL